MRAFKGAPAEADQSEAQSASAIGESQVESDIASEVGQADYTDDLGCGLFSLSTKLFSLPGATWSTLLLKLIFYTS